MQAFPTLRPSLLRRLALALGLLTGAAAGALADDYDDALEQSAERLAALRSYDVSGTLVLESNLAGRAEGTRLEVAFASAARWPDRLWVSQEGTVANLHLGVGPDASWFHHSQLGAAYRGGPATLSRSREKATPGELSAEQVFNFYGALGPLLLDDALTPTGAVGHETLTVGDRQVPCLVFEAAASADTAAATRSGGATCWYDPASGFCLKVRRVILEKRGGAEFARTVTHAVTSLAVDGPLDDARFHYEIPAGVRVVDSFDRLLNPDAMTGQPAPDVTLTDLEGREFRLSDFRGKVVFLDLWATWCGPCRMEMPHLEALHRELSPAGEVVFLAASSEERTVIAGFLEKNPYTFRIARISEDDAHGKFNATSIPTGFVIDREGVIRAHVVGAQNEAQLRRALAKAGVGD